MKPAPPVTNQRRGFPLSAAWTESGEGDILFFLCLFLLGGETIETRVFQQRGDGRLDRAGRGVLGAPSQLGDPGVAEPDHRHVPLPAILSARVVALDFEKPMPRMTRSAIPFTVMNEVDDRLKKLTCPLALRCTSRNVSMTSSTCR